MSRGQWANVSLSDYWKNQILSEANTQLVLIWCVAQSRCQYSFSIFGGMDRWIHGPKSKSFSCNEDYPQKTDLLHPGLWKLACTHHAILRLSASSATFGLHDSPTNPTSYSSDSIRASWRCHGSGLGQFSSGRLHHIQTALQASDLHLGSAS